MTSAEIRALYIRFFEGHGHRRVRSSSLIPAGDATLLFTNAGMVQFKDAFLGKENPGYKRAVTAQKCVRAGGKHNDLENVGFTARHHTFFEMLGNFSFGDYFKKEAIAFAWELLIEKYKIPTEKLRITVFEKDDEAFELWKKQGVNPDWIYRLGEKDNFWAMGDTGPCGPCSEIHYDFGNKYGCGKESCNPGCECGGRFLEIWNLVFMQFDRSADGKLTPLPKPSVDTGAGLERLSAVLQGKYNNYDSDVFTGIIGAIEKITGKKYLSDEVTTTAMRVIADHVRAGTFLIADGVEPSNEGRGYVLRRILRRAVRHGKKLGKDQPFIFSIVPAVVTSLGKVYPEIAEKQSVIQTIIQEEEERFHATLHRGLQLLDESVQKLKKSGAKVLPGEIAFKLYDTFGFPYDLIEVICQEDGFTVDLAGFEKNMTAQRARSSWTKDLKAENLTALEKNLTADIADTRFQGYETTRSKTPILSLFNAQGAKVDALKAGDQGFLLTAQTPFYPEGGGQIGDCGEIQTPSGKASVESTFKIRKIILHLCKVETGTLKKGEEADLRVDAEARQFTAINHSATHLLHAALRKTLGERVKQAGSLVDSSRLRFDFTSPKGMTEEEITEVENLVNREIWKRNPVTVRELPFDEAIAAGALAFFDEKYGDKVRVVTMGDDKPFSVELCGGTHLTSTAEIGLFKVVSESSVASGVRRIEAVTSKGAFDFLSNRSRALSRVEKQLAAKEDQVSKKLETLLADLKQLQKSNEQLQVKAAQSTAGESSLWDKKKQMGSCQLVVEQVPVADVKVIRTLVDQVRDKLKTKAVVLLAANAEGKAILCLGLSKDLTPQWSAGSLMQSLVKEFGGSGGGKPDFAQGGVDATHLPGVFQKLEQLVSEKS